LLLHISVSCHSEPRPSRHSECQRRIPRPTVILSVNEESHDHWTHSLTITHSAQSHTLPFINTDFSMLVIPDPDRESTAIKILFCPRPTVILSANEESSNQYSSQKTGPYPQGIISDSAPILNKNSRYKYIFLSPTPAL